MGDVFRSKRMIDPGSTPYRSATSSLVASQRVGRGRDRRAEGHGRRAHRSPRKRISTASRWASSPSASARVPIGLADAGQALAGESLDLGVLAVGLHGQGARRARQTARRQDVVGARRVVAGGLGRPRTDEDRPGVPQPIDRRFERLDVDRQVLRAVVVDERDRGVERGREGDQAVVPERRDRGCRAGRRASGHR